MQKLALAFCLFLFSSSLLHKIKMWLKINQNLKLTFALFGFFPLLRSKINRHFCVTRLLSSHFPSQCFNYLGSILQEEVSHTGRNILETWSEAETCLVHSAADWQDHAQHHLLSVHLNYNPRGSCTKSQAALQHFTVESYHRVKFHNTSVRGG